MHRSRAVGQGTTQTWFTVHVKTSFFWFSVVSLARVSRRLRREPSRPFLALMVVLRSTTAGVWRSDSSMVLITIDRGGAFAAASRSGGTAQKTSGKVGYVGHSHRAVTSGWVNAARERAMHRTFVGPGCVSQGSHLLLYY